MKKTLIITAPAKINIGLWVKEKRADGFHEIASLMQTISLADTITLKETTEEGIRIFCENPDVPEGPENIAHKAAILFFDKFNINPHIMINIEKKIPVAAGLAGGSTDAAAVLSGLTRMYDKAITIPDLMKLSSQIGSDIPFVVRGGFAHAEGRGEKLTFYDTPRPSYTVVIAIPAKTKVSTAWAYDNYIPSNNEKKSRDFNLIFDAYKRRDLTLLRNIVFNDLESVTLHRHPEVSEIKTLLASTGEGVTLMSGSGPSVFGLFSDRKSALRAVKKLYGMNVEVFIEHTTKRNP